MRDLVWFEEWREVSPAGQRVGCRATIKACRACGIAGGILDVVDVQEIAVLRAP